MTVKTIVINPNDVEYFDTCYNVEIFYGDIIYVAYANCEQDALDRIVDYLEARGETGYFYTPEEREEHEKEGSEFITAGNHCHALLAHEVVIRVRD